MVALEALSSKPVFPDSFYIPFLRFFFLFFLSLFILYLGFLKQANLIWCWTIALWWLMETIIIFLKVNRFSYLIISFFSDRGLVGELVASLIWRLRYHLTIFIILIPHNFAGIFIGYCYESSLDVSKKDHL